MENDRIIIKSNNTAQTDSVNFSRAEELGNVALYAVQQAESEARKFLEGKGYKDVKYITDVETDSVVIVVGNGKDIIVSVRGKDSPKDDDTVAVWGGKADSAIGGKVGVGYIEALHKNDKRLLTKVASAIQELDNKYEGKANINFASHSMGGALSSVMLAEIKAHQDEYPFSRNIKSILTFVSMPSGDDEFEKKYKEMCEKHQIECIDITNRNDLSFITPPPHRNVVNSRQVILNKDRTVTIDPNLTDTIGRLMDWNNPFAAHDNNNILAIIRELASKQGVTGGQDISADTNITGGGVGNRTDGLHR